VLIDIVIPTVDRQEGLKRAILAVSRQKLSFASVRTVVVDNSGDARQRQLVFELASMLGANVDLLYAHEPKAGLANARNRGIAESTGDHVVFLDDDQSPIDNFWLHNLVNTVVQTGADAAFGPVKAIAEPDGPRLSEIAAELHSRDLKIAGNSDVTGQLSSLGTGNSCFRRSSCFGADAKWFAQEFNYTGGEDIELLRRLRSSKRRFVWASQAAVFEFLPSARLDSAYLSNRRFAQGQQRVYLRITTPPRRFDAVIFLMAIGLAQTIYHFLAREIARLSASREKMEKHNIHIWGGLGKIFWQRRHRRKFYGTKTED
jgi:succinoglycan biosynthesis protein ExoM